MRKTVLFAAFLVVLLAGCQSVNASAPASATPTVPAVVQAPTVTASVSVPEPVTPTATFSAAATPEPSPTPQPSPIPTNEPQPAPANCADQVTFVADVTIPDFSQVELARPFVKTWRVTNSGTCPWGQGYRLVFLSGELMSNLTEFPLPAAAPGQTVDISIDMIAPDDPGGYTGNWQLLDSRGNPMPVSGSDVAYIWLKVTVPAAAPPAAPVSQPVPPASAPGCAATADAAFEARVLELINQERVSRGVPALSRSTGLDSAALEHSLDMSCQNFVDHYGYNGSTWFTRIQSQGYSYGYASENIAAGNPAFGGTADWVVQVRWMNSQVHRDNILNPGVTEIGISYRFNSAAQWGGYTTVNFAKPAR